MFGGRDEYVVANTGLKYEVGKPYGEFYYVRWVGVDPQDGQQIWLDKDGNETKYMMKIMLHIQETTVCSVVGWFQYTFRLEGLQCECRFLFHAGQVHDRQ